MRITMFTLFICGSCCFLAGRPTVGAICFLMGSTIGWLEALMAPWTLWKR